MLDVSLFRDLKNQSCNLIIGSKNIPIKRMCFEDRDALFVGGNHIPIKLQPPYYIVRKSIVFPLRFWVKMGVLTIWLFNLV